MKESEIAVVAKIENQFDSEIHYGSEIENL